MRGNARRIQRRRNRAEVIALTTRWRNSGSVSNILATGTTEGDEASDESDFLEPDLEGVCECEGDFTPGIRCRRQIHGLRVRRPSDKTVSVQADNMLCRIAKPEPLLRHADKPAK